MSLNNVVMSIFDIYIGEKMYKICVKLFKMLKNVFKMSYQITSPKQFEI